MLKLFFMHSSFLLGVFVRGVARFGLLAFGSSVGDVPHEPVFVFGIILVPLIEVWTFFVLLFKIWYFASVVSLQFFALHIIIFKINSSLLKLILQIIHLESHKGQIALMWQLFLFIDWIISIWVSLLYCFGLLRRILSFLHIFLRFCQGSRDIVEWLLDIFFVLFLFFLFSLFLLLHLLFEQAPVVSFLFLSFFGKGLLVFEEGVLQFLWFVGCFSNFFGFLEASRGVVVSLRDRMVLWRGMFYKFFTGVGVTEWIVFLAVLKL